MTRRGQLLVLAAAILASAILLHLAWVATAYRGYTMMKFCGPLESAELISVVRAGIAWNSSLLALISKLKSLGAKYGHCIELYDVGLKEDTRLTGPGGGLYRVVLENRAGRIVYEAYWNYTYITDYLKKTPFGARVYSLYRLTYTNRYLAPQWGAIVTCPKIMVPGDGKALTIDLKRVGRCEWLVGAPKGTSLTLRDEFGAPIVLVAHDGPG